MHPEAPICCHWLEDSLGRKRVTAEYSVCRRRLGHPPSIPPYSTMADAAASPTAVLDVLTRLDALAIELEGDGRRVWLKYKDYSRVSPDLRALIRSSSHQLAGLLGKR
jgi:hypothetical protein